MKIELTYILYNDNTNFNDIKNKFNQEKKMLGKIGLEEHFAVPETLGDSMIYFKNNNDIRTTRLLDLLDLRVEEMDKNGMDMMILSLNSPAIQGIYQKDKAISTAKLANDKLAEALAKRNERFRGFAALPLQDPDAAIKEMHRAVEELGFVGVLVNGYSQIDTEDNYKYLDDPMYDAFWAELEKMDVPFYMHPREPMPCNSHYMDGHYALNGAVWLFGVETASHVLRLMNSGLFDKYPKLKIVIGHLGEGLPFFLWRADNHLKKRRRDCKAEKPFMQYLVENIWVTTSGQFYAPALACTMMAMGTDRILFSTDYPFEEVPDACNWFDKVSISEPDRYKIGRQNCIDLFKLDLK